ncbi:MAG: helix-turn-helix domain-containing protein [Novosphingobium sp.]
MNAPPKRRSPAVRGPGFEEQHALANAPTSYRNCRWPAPGTARAAVLNALLAGRILTSLTAWRELGASRLAADVHALRGLGWPILSEEADVAAREGRSARIAQYRIEVQP